MHTQSDQRPVVSRWLRRAAAFAKVYVSTVRRNVHTWASLLKSRCIAAAKYTVRVLSLVLDATLTMARRAIDLYRRTEAWISHFGAELLLFTWAVRSLLMLLVLQGALFLLAVRFPWLWIPALALAAVLLVSIIGAMRGKSPSGDDNEYPSLPPKSLVVWIRRGLRAVVTAAGMLLFLTEVGTRYSDAPLITGFFQGWSDPLQWEWQNPIQLAWAIERGSPIGPPSILAYQEPPVPANPDAFDNRLKSIGGAALMPTDTARSASFHIMVDEDGVPRSTRTHLSSGYASFDSAMQRALGDTHFIPATYNGRSVVGWILVRLTISRIE